MPVVNINYAVRMLCGERYKTVECPSIRPSVRPVDRQQLLLAPRRTTRRPRKFWSDCKEIQHSSVLYWVAR